VTAFLSQFTWERFLVVWGLVVPGIAWIATRRWERANEKARWGHEADVRKQADSAEASRREAERRQSALEALRERMRDTYTRFLAGATALTIGADLRYPEERKAATDAALPDFVLSYQQLLLVASNDAAQAAVDVWKAVNLLISSAVPDAEKTSSRDQIASGRTRFVHEAREDLDDPITRNANPGLVVQPLLTAGGFHLEDVG
jgi:hypothetical protein